MITFKFHFVLFVPVSESGCAPALQRTGGLSSACSKAVMAGTRARLPRAMDVAQLNAFSVRADPRKLRRELHASVAEDTATSPWIADTHLRSIPRISKQGRWGAGAAGVKARWLVYIQSPNWGSLSWPDDVFIYWTGSTPDRIGA
jgi:hypothetical protein